MLEFHIYIYLFDSEKKARYLELIRLGKFLEFLKHKIMELL